MQRVYLDNAATTMVRPEAVEAMLPVFTDVYGNPSSLHGYAQDAGKLLSESRAKVASAIGALPEEIIFTGGGSESDNMILRGVAKAYAKRAATSSARRWSTTRSCIRSKPWKRKASRSSRCCLLMNSVW